MEVRIDIKGVAGVQAMLNAFPRQARRAAELALDATALAIRNDIRSTMPRVFDRPVAWTLNSLKVTKTKGHNMIAKVGFKEPDRMQQHYLVPQVEGGKRHLKGFERAVGGGEYDLAVGAKRTAAGNITVGQSKGIVAGVKQRRGADYVVIKAGNKQGLPAGVYQRTKTSGGFGRKVTRTMSYTAQKGRKRGRFVSAILARGLKPIIIKKERKGESIKPRLDFYGIAQSTFDAEFSSRFWSNLDRLLPR
jgi:hypothetical protein